MLARKYDKKKEPAAKPAKKERKPRKVAKKAKISKKDAKKKHAVCFPEGDGGYVLAQALSQGKQAQIFSVRSVDDDNTYVRKKMDAVWGETDEAEIYEYLLPSIAPKLVLYTKYEYKGDALIYEFCNGGDLENFLTATIEKEHIIPEALFWTMAKQLTESVAYIHDKWVSKPPKASSTKASSTKASSTKASSTRTRSKRARSKETKSQEKEVESEEWISIAHRDIHIGNIFLSWPDSKPSSPFPQFLIGDWAQAIHLNPFNLGNGKGNYNRRKALNYDLEMVLECLTDLNHWRRPDVKPENCPIWQFSRLWEEAKVKAYDQERERIKFDMASHIAETFIPLAEKNIKREMKGKVLSFQWTKPDIPDTIQIFDGDKKKKLKDWLEKNELKRLKRPWDWIDIEELPAEMVSKTKKPKASSDAEGDSDDAFGFAAPTSDLKLERLHRVFQNAGKVGRKLDGMETEMVGKEMQQKSENKAGEGSLGSHLGPDLDLGLLHELFQSRKVRN